MDTSMVSFDLDLKAMEMYFLYKHLPAEVNSLE